MSALCASSLRTISPHRKTLLIGLSGWDASPHANSLQAQNASCRHQKFPDSSSRPYSVSTRRPSSSRSQSTYIQLRKESRAQAAGKIRAGKVQQQQSVTKVLHKVHLSSWAKGGLSNIVSSLGTVSTAPGRLAEEVGRLLGRSSRHSQDAAQTLAQNSQQTKILPAASEKIKKVNKVIAVVTERPKARERPVVEGGVREEHTFEQAMDITRDSIRSYYHPFLSTTPSPTLSKSANTVAATAAAVLPRSPSSTSKAPSPRPALGSPKTIFPSSPKAGSPKVTQDNDAGWSQLFKNFPMSFRSVETSAAVPPIKKKPLVRKDFVSRSALEARTRSLVTSLRGASSRTSKLVRTQDLIKHLKLHPSGRHEASECKAVPVLLQMTQQTEYQELREEALEALALLGYSQPVKGRGIRILTLDGGGTRGLMTLQCLKKLEEVSGRRVHQLFDYVCGVSTGGLIAAMLVLYQLPLEQCRKLYLEFSSEMFSRGRMRGTSGLVWNHSFYDSDRWEKILQTELGEAAMIEFSRCPDMPKMSAVSTLLNLPRLKNFVFRNYNLPPSTYSIYPGSCSHRIWEVIRATSAAPGYFEDFRLGDYVHSDGGISTNNPTAIAVHESRLLWPNERIQCVVSLGTGRYEPQVELGGSSKVSLKEKVSKIVDSATDTEGVHIMMNDVMSPGTYFRFNPYLSEDLQLDEIREDRIEAMERDTQLYLRKNEKKVEKAAAALREGRMVHQHTMDLLKLKVDTYI